MKNCSEKIKAISFEYPLTVEKDMSLINSSRDLFLLAKTGNFQTKISESESSSPEQVIELPFLETSKT